MRPLMRKNYRRLISPKSLFFRSSLSQDGFLCSASIIYYSVITFIARDLRTTVAIMNLKVMMYMMMSGIVEGLGKGSWDGER